MRARKRLLYSILVAIAVTAALTLTAGASDGEGTKLLRSSLAPSVPTDPAFHGVTPGGVPWVLDRGEVSIKADGQFDLALDGLVIPALGTPGPVVSVSASLYCGADANTTPAATTGSVPLSRSGDARIRDHVALPATCLAPIVLVHPNGGLARYIAVTGWGG